MSNKVEKDLIEKGFSVLHGCIEKKLIVLIKQTLNNHLIKILKSKKKKFFKDLNLNYYQVKKFKSQHEIQVLLAKELVNKNLISDILMQKKIFNNLFPILGKDIEYQADMELAINDSTSDKKDDYLRKKFHQEFWSGVGIESLLLWIPLQLLNNMGTLELIEKSHTWGHIPHENREPLKMPDHFKKKQVSIKEGSLLIMTSLTLHQTIENNHSKPRIAIPVVVRNFYYPNTNNIDLLEFRKLNFSFFSKFRKILGNNKYSPFRTLGQKRKSIFLKYNLVKNQKYE